MRMLNIDPTQINGYAVIAYHGQRRPMIFDLFTKHNKPSLTFNSQDRVIVFYEDGEYSIFGVAFRAQRPRQKHMDGVISQFGEIAAQHIGKKLDTAYFLPNPI